MIKPAGLSLLLLTACATPAFGSDSCQVLQDQIEAKIRAAGVASFSLVTVDSQAEVPGKVVGSCRLGSKKIVYGSAPAAAAGARPASAASPAAKVFSTTRSDPILTECKDGSVSIGGACKP